MSTEFKSRRDFLKITAMGSAGAILTLHLSGRTATRSATTPDSQWEIKLGVASYSLREFSRTDAIKMIQELRTSYVNIKSFHQPYMISKPRFTTTGPKTSISRRQRMP